MAVLAQLVEHWIVIPRVTGSSPVRRPTSKPLLPMVSGAFSLFFYEDFQCSEFCVELRGKGRLIHNSLIFNNILARPERFELPTPWFEAKCSIQMSYGRFFLLEYEYSHYT